MVLIFALITLGAAPAKAKITFSRATCATLLLRIAAATDRAVSLDARPWDLGAETEARIAALYDQSDLADSTRVFRSINLMMSRRAAEKRSRLKKFFFEHALRSGLDPEHWYPKTIGKLIARIGGAHNIVFTPFVSLGDAHPADPAAGITAIHEINHAFDHAFHSLKSLAVLISRVLNVNLLFLRNPVAPLLHNRLERSAIGAQWELVRRIPPAVRARIIADIDNLKYAKPVSPQRLQAYQHVVGAGLYDRFELALRRLEQNGLLPSRGFSIDHLLTNVKAQKNSPVWVYRRAFRKLDKSRVASLLGAEELTLLESLMKNVEAGTPSEPAKLQGRGQSATFEALVKFHQTNHRRSAAALSDFIARMSLQYADLDKASFIDQMEAMQGYAARDLLRDEFLRFWTGWRKVLIAQALFTLLTGGSNFWAFDVQWIYHHLTSLF